jgi:hypothetical protein
MKKLVLSFYCIVILSSINLLACSSDYDCDIGNSCVKELYSSEGVCMKNVDEFGIPDYSMPDPDSIGPNMDNEGGCTFNTDCPIGFECSSKYKICIKR